MECVHRWQQQYLGTTVFPKTLSRVEFQAFFTFSEDELKAIRDRFHKQNRVAAGVQLGFLRMTGAPLEKAAVIPSKLLGHVSTQLGMPALTIASLRAIYGRPKTLYEHQCWAVDTLKFSRASSEQLKPMRSFLRRQADFIANVDLLVDQGRQWLYLERFLSIADRAIRDVAREAMAESEAELLGLIRKQFSPVKIRDIESTVLKLHPASGRTVLEWLQQPPRKKSINALRERVSRVEFIKGLGIHNLDFTGIPIEKIRGYSSELKGMQIAKVKELTQSTRTLRLICHLKMILMQASDAAILLGGRLTARITRDAYDKAQFVEAKGALSIARAFEDIANHVHDTSMDADQFRAFVARLVEEQKPREFPTRAAAARWLLSEPNPQIRALLNELQKLGVQAEPNDPSGVRMEYLANLYQSRTAELPEKPTVEIPRPWKDIIEGEDRERAMRALEAATLIGLRKSLRSGSVYVECSEKFRGRHRLLIDEKRWEAEKHDHYAKLGLPAKAEEFLQGLVAELKTKLQKLGSVVKDGQLHIRDGYLHLPRDKKNVIGPEVAQNKDALFDRIGVVQLPDLILEMDSRIGVTKALLGRIARSDTELLQLYAGMLAHGTAMDASVVSLMLPQLTPSQIIAGMRLFEDRDVVRAANDTVVSFQRRLPIASWWGDGTLASSDMTSLDVSRHIWLARLDPKRGIPSVGTYTHLSDRWSVIFDQPIVLNERQAGAAIEGVIRQREIEIERLAVDTHGYTECAMAIAKLLGFALCPRLKRISERRFYVPSDMKDVFADLDGLLVGTISLRRITAEWDELVRLAASIETGHTSATVALARFGSAASDSPVYRAAVHLGRLIRSIYLCDYFLSEELRRTVNRILVHGEAVHTLQRAINAGTFSKPRGRTDDDLFAVSGSLTLLTNMCLAWTTAHMDEALFGEGGIAGEFDNLEWLRHTSPAGYGNINFRGTFSFDVSAYQEKLIARGARASGQN